MFTIASPLIPAVVAPARAILRTVEGLEAILPLPAMGCGLPLADIYDKVSFGRDDFITDAK